MQRSCEDVNEMASEKSEIIGTNKMAKYDKR